MLTNTEDFSIIDPPKADDTEAVGKWVWIAFELSRAWRDDVLGMSDAWRENYKLFRGDHWAGNVRNPNQVTVNLFYANIIRTVANITARHPIAEVIDLEGGEDNQATIFTARTKKWWIDTNQQAKLRATALNSEVYGITWEKSIWNDRFKWPDVVVCDCFAMFPFPGYYENMATDCPAIFHATAMEPRIAEKKYKTKDVEASSTYALLGGDREEIKGTSSYGTNRGTIGMNEQSQISKVQSIRAGEKGENALIVEMWCRDFSTEKDEEGNDIAIYPGGIRCITVTNEGKKVLADKKNPAINFQLPKEQIEINYLYKRFPFYKANSYQDTSSIFGFSAAEQTAGLVKKIDELISRLVNYAMRSMTGILVIPPGSGVTKNHLNNKPNLVLWMDTHEAARGVRIIPSPTPPAIIQQMTDMLIALHDRVHAIQDVDRGDTPKNITAASAIVALQERNAVLVQHKIDANDYLVQERGNYAVAQWQNHGHQMETIIADNETFTFTGIKMSAKKFNYVVESGSSMPKTSLQLQEQSEALFKAGAIDQQALLENLNFPGWRKIVERMAEDHLNQAIQVLIGAGMPEDQAQMIIELLSEDQGGPGNGPQSPPGEAGPKTPKPGIPKEKQGQDPNQRLAQLKMLKQGNK